MKIELKIKTASVALLTFVWVDEALRSSESFVREYVNERDQKEIWIKGILQRLRWVAV
jgi:hypothetical protein